MLKMTPAQLKFIALEKKKEEVKQYFNQLQAAIAEVAAEIGIGGHFQDQDGIVYKIVEPEGKFVHFEKISYVRTKRPHETRGDLSVKEATSYGYQIPK
jgi:hypothetical protein